MAVTKLLRVSALLLTLLTSTLNAAVLPEDRTDILYHGYEGGGMNIDGPSVLVRKSIANKVSLWGNYYEDLISSASVDVVTQGSAYTEERQEYSLGVDYLHNKSLLSLSFTDSSENDYDAKTLGFGASQDFFGDLTSISIQYAIGEDEVRKNNYVNGVIESATDVGDAKHKRFGISISQIIYKYMTLSFTAESVVDEGVLNNPYRSYRYYSDDAKTTFNTEFENYPPTRSSDAFALRGIHYLPYRAAVRAEFRMFSDSWGIDAYNYELRYIHPYKNWTFETKYRFYSQTAAVFFKDTFEIEDVLNQDYFASDKEMDALTNTSFGFGASYEIKSKYLSWFDKSTVNLFVDVMNFEYENYRDRTQSLEADDGSSAKFKQGEEPLYSFDANVVRVFFSFWY